MSCSRDISFPLARLLTGIGSLDDRFVVPPRVTGAPELYGCLMQTSFMLLNANPTQAEACDLIGLVRRVCPGRSDGKLAFAVQE